MKKVVLAANYDKIVKLPKKRNKPFLVLTDEKVLRTKRGVLDAEAFQRTIKPYMKTSRINRLLTIYPPKHKPIMISFWRDPFGYITVRYAESTEIRYLFKIDSNRDLLIKLRNNKLI
jgi:hypothetical protein